MRGHAHAYPLCARQTRRRESTANELADVTAALRGARAEADALRGRLAAAIADGAWHRVASPAMQRPSSLAHVGTHVQARRAPALLRMPSKRHARPPPPRLQTRRAHTAPRPLR